MNTTAIQALRVAGPAGEIEGSLQEVPAATGVVILCHPHSQYGGSMHDAVVGVLGEACAAASLTVIKFNFRSVGGSEGQFDHGVGEIEDVLAMVSWAEERYPNTEILLGGYSFGAAMALLGAARIQDRLSKLILVAPPIQMVQSDAALSIPLQVIVGGRDTIVSAAAAAQYFESNQMVLLPQADHFFGGAFDDLRVAVNEFLQR